VMAGVFLLAILVFYTSNTLLRCADFQSSEHLFKSTFKVSSKLVRSFLPEMY